MNSGVSAPDFEPRRGVGAAASSRWRSLAFTVVVFGCGALVGASSGWTSGAHEVDLYLLGAVGGLVLLVLAVGALLRKRWYRACFALLALVAGVVVTAHAEDLRWRWSEAQLREVAAHPHDWAACDFANPCQAGWWRVVAVRQVGTITLIRSPDARPCEFGGIVLLTAETTRADVEAAVAEEFESIAYRRVSPFRDGWLDVCAWT